MHAVVAGVRRRTEPELLPLGEDAAAQRAGRRLGRVGRPEHLAAEVGPRERARVELDEEEVDVRVGGGELAAHRHEAEKTWREEILICSARPRAQAGRRCMGPASAAYGTY